MSMASVVMDTFTSTCPQHLQYLLNWTVLSAVVVHDNVADAYQVLSWGTGTKCLGPDKWHPGGSIIVDAHAESIAKRAFQRFLWDLAIKKQAHPLFTMTTNEKVQLQANCTLHIYVSEAPCGDAALYKIDENLHNEIQVIRRTGSKAVSGDLEKEHQVGNKRRFKSCNSSLPVSQQSTSMSCTDKVALWHHVGLQGTLLSKFVHIIPWTSVVCSQDTRNVSHSEQHQVLSNALLRHLQHDDSAYVTITKEQFPYSRWKLKEQTKVPKKPCAFELVLEISSR